MERLTESHFGADDHYMKCSEFCSNDDEMCAICPKHDEMINRLAAYEDTGLAPADVVDLMGSHAMAICELAMVPKWIPVAESKPSNIDERVLVKVREDSVAGYPAMDTDRYVIDGWVRYGNRVTHWMPLPEDPGKEGP